MSDEQRACLFAALPFLSLSIAWLVGLALVFRPQPKTVRIRKERQR